MNVHAKPRERFKTISAMQARAGRGLTGYVRRHFVARLLLALVLGVAAIEVCATVYFSRQHERNLRSDLQKQVQVLRTIIEHSYPEPMWNIHRELLQTMNEAILSDLPFLALSLREIGHDETLGTFLTTQKAVVQGKIRFRHSGEAPDLPRETLSYISGRLHHGDRIIGEYTLYYSTAYIRDLVRQQTHSLAWVFLVMAVLTVLLLAFWLHHILIRRILRIASFARSVSEGGRYDSRLIPSCFDEICIVAESLNIMLDQIETHERKQQETERDLRRSQTYLQNILDASPDIMLMHDIHTGMVLDVNPTVCRLYNLPRSRIVGRGLELFCGDAPPFDKASAFEWLQKAMFEGVQNFVWRFEFSNEQVLWADIILCHFVVDGQDWGLLVGRDISERLRADEERERLQRQLIQAQKIETVGRLAGGVAHDFNNMLGVILGFTEMALEEVAPGQSLHEGLLEIQKAAERSANLTRQLLAFARKQTISPRLLDLNATVEGMLSMLRRLIGEHVRLAWHPGKGLPKILMDAAQLDQILVNLCVNARDAIEKEGLVSIETGYIYFSPEDCADQADRTPGHYLRLSVTDNGRGMDAETRAHLFEPFFTTKNLGEGTGLGLATLYGIIRQNNGFVHVYSELGKGTTFNLYLPIPEESAPPPLETPAQTSPATAGAVQAAAPAMAPANLILLVEDDPSLMRMTSAMLKRLGYGVLQAPTTDEAIRLGQQHRDDIKLLFTDIVMPGMNGRDLAQHLLAENPALKRLFMSGYTSELVKQQGPAGAEIHFIQKPFTMKELDAKLREVLRGETS